MKLCKLLSIGLIFALSATASRLHPKYSAEVTSRLERVMVVHRHGARTALLECENPACKRAPLVPAEEGPGVLTEEGKLMLFQLGKHLQSRYGGSAGLFPPTYNPRRLYTRAADEDRTIQSGIAMLRGLYCENFMGDQSSPSPACNDTHNGFGSIRYPTVHTMQKHEDLYLDPWGGMPILTLRYHVGEKEKIRYMDKAVQSTWSNATMKQLAAETGFGSECPERPYDCAGDAIDFARYAQSKGILESQFPLLNRLLPEANRLWSLANNYTYHGPLFHPSRSPANFTTTVGTTTGLAAVDKTSDLKVLTGNVGFPLAKELARNARGVIEAAETSSFSSGTNIPHTFDQNPILVHYSGHDVTLIPLTSALGNDTAAINPPFGSALIIEVWNRTSPLSLSSSPGTQQSQRRYVKAEYGSPINLTLDTSIPFAENFKYQPEAYALHCMRADGTIYSSTATSSADDGCLLEDWERFIDHHSAPSRILQVAFGGDAVSSSSSSDGAGSGELLDFNLPVASTIYCNALASDLEAINCLPTQDSSIPILRGSHCYNYRRRCPLMACAYVRLSDGELVRSGYLQMNLTCVS